MFLTIFGNNKCIKIVEIWTTFDEYFTRANPDPQPKEATWDSSMSSFIPPRNSKTDKNLHDVSSLIGIMRIDMAKPNSQLTDHHHTQARLANSATKAFLEGVDEAQIYLHHEGLIKRSLIVRVMELC